MKFLAVVLLPVALLFAMGVYFMKKVSSEVVPPVTQVSNDSFRERLKSPRSRTGSDAAGQPRVVYVTNKFNWSEIESEDYHQYIANLRAVGCPENTIKDIILTDVMKLYASRRGQLQHNGREFKYWETDEKRSLTARQFEEREKELASINKELPSVLRELLGVNYERELAKYFTDTNEDERRLGFLPQEKQAQLLALRDKYEGLREKVLYGANGNPSPADLEALRKIEEQRKAELGGILGGTELAQFELTTSPTAERLRTELVGFNPSEAEFRTIYDLQNTLHENFALANTNDSTVLQQKAAMQRDVDLEIRRQLGEKRYAEYALAQNPDYRNTYSFAAMHQLPASTAKTIFEIKQIADEERRNLMANTTLPEADRWEALRAMQVQIEQGLQQNLGTKTFSNYSRNSGKWIWDMTDIKLRD